MASARRVQILLQALLELLKKVVSKAAVPIRILWTILRILVPVSRLGRGHIDADGTRRATTYTTLPPSVDLTKIPGPSRPPASSPNVNGTYPSSNEAVGDILPTSPGLPERPEPLELLEGPTENTDATPDEIVLITTVPSELRRYVRTIRTPTTSPSWTVPPCALKNTFNKDSSPPVGWVACVHPEGALYYRRTVDNLVFLTDANVTLSGLRKQVELVISILKIKYRLAINAHLLQLTPNQPPLEIVIDAEHDVNGDTWAYYVVDHTYQQLFWFDSHTFFNTVVVSIAHIGQLLKVGYYEHLNLYPHYHPLSDSVFAETQGMLIWGLADKLTSSDSLAPYDEKTTDRFLRLINHAKDVKEEAPVDYIATLARVRFTLEYTRFTNLSGLPFARLSQMQSVQGHVKEKPSLLFQIVDLLLLKMPEIYLRFLDGVCIDNVAFRVPFNKFVAKVTSEWQQDVINAAVLFTANIAFLAIPSLLPPDTGDINAAAAASIISIILSFSSILFGQLLNKKIEALAEAPLGQIADYFCKWDSAKRGYSKLAVMYSLPYVLMIWGAAAFVLGVLFFTFRDFKLNAQMTAIIAFLAGAISLCLWIVFEISVTLPRLKLMLMRMGAIMGLKSKEDCYCKFEANRILRQPEGGLNHQQFNLDGIGHQTTPQLQYSV